MFYDSMPIAVVPFAVVSNKTSVYIITTHLPNIPTFFLIFDIHYKTFNVIQGITCVPAKLQLLIPGKKGSSQPPLGSWLLFTYQISFPAEVSSSSESASQ